MTLGLLPNMQQRAEKCHADSKLEWARLPAHHGAPKAVAVFGWEEKLREAARIAALGLAGRATDLAVILLVYLNHEHGVAFPGVEDLAAALNCSEETIGRATAELDRAGAARFAKRRGAAARWFPRLLDMSAEEAKARVALLQTRRRERRSVDPSRVTDHDGPSKSGSADPPSRAAKMTDLKTPRNHQTINFGGAHGAAAAERAPSQRAFDLVDTIAEITGLPRESYNWPRAWREDAPKRAEQWLHDRGWPFDVCVQVARVVMRTAKLHPVNSLQYFEPAIERAWNAISTSS